MRLTRKEYMSKARMMWFVLHFPSVRWVGPLKKLKWSSGPSRGGFTFTIVKSTKILKKQKKENMLEVVVKEIESQ